MNISTHIFAVTYNCNAYGASTYSSDAACTTGTETGGQQTGGLAGTGVDFWVPLVLGAVLFLGGVALLIRRMVKSGKKQ
jgi:hypothetical protein